MLLQEPGHSAYDLRFSFLGFPVRITWGFWLMAFVLGHSLVRSLDGYFGDSTPGMLPLLVLWAICVLVSILIHELGHALAFRRYGIESSIVLYHFGGLAIPRGSARSNGSLTPPQNIWISFAGPLAQLASAALLIVVIKVTGSGFRVSHELAGENQRAISILDFLPVFFEKFSELLTGDPIHSAGLFAMITFYILPSIFWAILNLIPVWPLDGGRIMSGIVEWRGGNMSQALWISVISAGFAAAYGFTHGQQFLAIMFAMLGISNFQQLQHSGESHY